LKPLAEQGHAAAQEKLGYAYDFGEVVPISLVVRFDYLSLASSTCCTIT
jgi:TPR repeat protein